jgi:phosphoglycerate dehydrogenase-like enzyme
VADSTEPPAAAGARRRLRWHRSRGDTAGVTLCNVFEHEPGVSEYALLAMLEWCHRLCSADREMRSGIWTALPASAVRRMTSLRARHWCIVGLGRIGRAVARRARAFDMRVLAVNRSADKTIPVSSGRGPRPAARHAP